MKNQSYVMNLRFTGTPSFFSLQYRPKENINNMVATKAVTATPKATHPAVVSKLSTSAKMHPYLGGPRVTSRYIQNKVGLQMPWHYRLTSNVFKMLRV
jgi:hypothetical protein